MPLFSGTDDFSGIGASPVSNDWSNLGGGQSDSGSWLSGIGNWVNQNKGDIQSALKGGSQLAGQGTGQTGFGAGQSGVRTDVTAQAGMHQGQAGTLNDLYQQLMARRFGVSGSTGRSGGGLLGM